MERGVTEEIIYTEPKYSKPYTNHYGYGSDVGCGNIYGTGSGFKKYKRKEIYNGNGILSYNNNKTYFFDGYVVIITHIHKPWIMGEIIKNDLTTQKCYLAKVNNNVVVSDSIRGVIEGMRLKMTNSKITNDDIAKAFVLAHPDYDKLYDWDEMVSWHTLEPTSCVAGRQKFTKLAHKKSGDLATPKELVHHMKKGSAKKLGEKIEQTYKMP